MVETIYDSEYITVEYHTDHEMIMHVVHKPIGNHPQILKDAVNAGTEVLAEHKLTKWLSDDRNNGPLPQELVDWGNEDWNQRAVGLGWKYWASVVPQDMAAAGTLTPVIHNLSKLGLQMRVFTSVEDAIEWLDSL